MNWPSPLPAPAVLPCDKRLPGSQMLACPAQHGCLCAELWGWHACSIYIAGLDVLEVKVTVGAKDYKVLNNDQKLVDEVGAIPGVNANWYDQHNKMFGITFSTDGIDIPGMLPSNTA